MTDTITCEGAFGKPKQVTKADFVSQWKNHVYQMIWALDMDTELADTVEAAATRRWEELHSKEHGSA